MPNAVYMPKRTFIVTKVNNNYLVRGNQPLNPDGSFAYDAIGKKLKSLVGGNFDLKNYKLIDVSLIDNNPVSEGGDLALEFAGYGMSQADFNTNFPFPAAWPPYFRGLAVTKQWQTSVNGNPGSIIWYPVQGCTDNGNCESVEPAQFNFNGTVDMLSNLLSTESNAVIYIHCEHGHDRTSALTAGYMMKYMKMSLEDVLTLGPPKGAKAFKHDWEVNYEALVKWYATQL
jgi:translation initiation factor IF-1